MDRQQQKIGHLVLLRENGGRSIEPNKCLEKIESSDLAYIFHPVFQLEDMSFFVKMTTKISSNQKLFLNSFYKRI